MSAIITVKSKINADRKKVWDYYTNPKHITQWNFADPSWQCPSAKNDMRIGGKYFARMEAKDGSFGFDFEAVYTELKEGEKFTYKLGDGRLVSVSLIENAGSTEAIVTFDAEDQNPVEFQKDGWQAILDNFKRYTETN